MKKFISALLIVLFANNPILAKEDSSSNLSGTSIGLIAGGSLGLVAIIVVIAVLVKKGIIRFDRRFNVQEFTITGKGIEFVDQRFEFPQLKGLISPKDLEGSFNALLSSQNKRAKFLEVYNYFAESAGLNTITDNGFKRLLELNRDKIINAFKEDKLFIFDQDSQKDSTQYEVESLDNLLKEVEVDLNKPITEASEAKPVASIEIHDDPYIAHPIDDNPSGVYVARSAEL